MIYLFAFLIIVGIACSIYLQTKNSKKDIDFTYLEKILRQENSTQRMELNNTISNFGKSLKDDFQNLEHRQDSSFLNYDNILKERFNEMAKYLRENNDRVVLSVKETSNSIEIRLKEIREDNEKQLEKMRQTVDEKLQTTLEKRLSESFQRVSEQLESVYKSIGEMKTLAGDVGDLKKVLSNVKVRGTWGEYQLGNILEQILTPNQYDLNVSTKPNCAERVEFAVKLPGKNIDDPTSFIYLPIDSKFPLEDYQILVTASELGDLDMIKTARKNLLTRIKSCAKDIKDKYLEAPFTTDFAIMFLPIEGLYAEVLRENGVFEELQRNYKVTITGPTTLSAFLNSLQMGFRTLSIEKKSALVWQTLAAVKTEFGNFGAALSKVEQQISTAKSTIENLNSTRMNAMNRKLRSLDTIEVDKAAEILGIEEAPEE